MPENFVTPTISEDDGYDPDSPQFAAMPELHSHLMRAHVKRNPYRYYSVIRVLGEGSMGRVEEVQKEGSVVGGSARTAFVENERRRNQDCCFVLPTAFLKLLSPFSFCPIKRHDHFHDGQSDSNIFSSSDRDRKQQQQHPRSANGGSNSNQHKRNNFRNSRDAHGDFNKLSVATDDTLPSTARSSSKTTLAHSTSAHSTSSMITFGHKKEVVYALKSIHLDMVKNDAMLKRELNNEISILRSLDHPNIVKAMETYDYKNHLFLVLELASGGDLYTRDPYTERQACTLMTGIVDAISYLHSRKIIHRDLKFENIMFASYESEEIKIIDFGLSKKYAQSERLHDAVGTVYTMAPEVIMGNYAEKVDVWSIGVIAFMLLSSSLPFYGKTRQHVIRRVVKGRYSFEGYRWNTTSLAAKQFIHKLLKLNPADRPTAIQVLDLPWLQQNVEHMHKRSRRMSECLAFDRVQASIQSFAGYRRLKKLALLVIAHKSTDEEIGFLRQIFRQIDTSKDSGISINEFKEALADYQYSDVELEHMFHAIDIYGTGEIHYSEFLAATMEAHGQIEEERIAEAFDLIDADDSGFITVANLKDFLGKQLPDAYLNAIIDEVDVDHDHCISYEEFLALWDEAEDMKLRENYLCGAKRRQESMDAMSSSGSSGSLSEEMTESVSALSRGSMTSNELGGGMYFFDVEKQKSVRLSQPPQQ